MLAMDLSQTFELHDLAVVGLLVVLEGVLSIDNALVLGLLAKNLPPAQQRKALTYGLVGAFVFRFLAVGTATFLLQWSWVKLLGGGYLVYIAAKHFWQSRQGHHEDSPHAPGFAKNAGSRFWLTVLMIELTDIAFAIDSILAAIALVGPAQPGDTGLHDKFWVIITGGLLGVVLMRFAAVLFIKLLEKFPRFETAAYLLVTVIGLKLLIDYVGNDLLSHAPGAHPVNFHSYHNPWFWAFWIAMLLCFSVGFYRGKTSAPEQASP